MLVYLVEEAEILVQLGHKLREFRTLEFGCAFAVTHGHAVGGTPDHDLHELAIILDVLLEFALLDAI